MLKSSNLLASTQVGTLQQSVDYEKLENARLLSANEYSYNALLGYVSLNQSLNNDELLKFWNKFVPDKIQRCSTFAAAKCKTTSGAIEITESFIAGINMLQTSGSSLTAVGSALWWDDVVKDPTRINFEPIAAKGVCSNDINIAKAKCSSNPECEAIAKQSNPNFG